MSWCAAPKLEVKLSLAKAQEFSSSFSKATVFINRGILSQHGRALIVCLVLTVACTTVLQRCFALCFALCWLYCAYYDLPPEAQLANYGRWRGKAPELLSNYFGAGVRGCDQKGVALSAIWKLNRVLENARPASRICRHGASLTVGV